ncbi:hypothetical protein MMC25_008233 [Agyrium rufum]|nr:hypothetical protein [Agyrium rufum]
MASSVQRPGGDRYKDGRRPSRGRATDRFDEESQNSNPGDLTPTTTSTTMDFRSVGLPGRPYTPEYEDRRVKDPVSIHLLMENALTDSQHYDILQPEEVDRLKKQLSVLNTRLDTTKRRLLLETKMRDATASLNRLNKTGDSSPDRNSGSPKRTSSPASIARKHVRSFLGSRGSSVDFAKEADEYQASIKKCENLTQEVWQLEQWERELQTKLLQHTAGILQMTHSRSESHDSGISGMSNDFGASSSHSFDDKSRYRPYSGSEDSAIDYINGDSSKQRAEFARQTQLILDVEVKVEGLNSRLRSVLQEMKPKLEHIPQIPSGFEHEDDDAGEILWSQVEFTENVIDVLQHAQSQQTLGSEETQRAIEEKLEIINAKLCKIMNRSSLGLDWKYAKPPKVSGQGLADQIDYLKAGLQAVDRRVQQLAESSASSLERLVTHDKTAQQYEAVMQGLFTELVLADQESDADQSYGDEERYSLPVFADKLQSFINKARDTAQERDTLEADLQDQSHGHRIDVAEHAANLEDVHTELQETKKELDKTSLESQDHKDRLALFLGELETTKNALREVEGASKALESEKASRELVEASMHETKSQLAKAELETQVHKDRLALFLGELETTKEASRAAESKAATHETTITDLQNQLKTLQNDPIAAALPAKLETAEQAVQRLTSQLEESRASSSVMEVNNMALRSDLEEKSKMVDDCKVQLTDRESEFARLQTELTFAKAELDSAYGTRAQRAAEREAQNASSIEVQRDVQEAHRRADTLRLELEEMSVDYEGMVRTSMENEREREKLENVIDGLRHKVEELDAQIQDDRIQMMGGGLKSPGMMSTVSGAGGDRGTSTTVLKNEFKKIVREIRAEHMKALKASSEIRYLLQFLCVE